MSGTTKEQGLRRFKPYPVYKDSGIEWLGQMPSHWSVRKWRYCCNVTRGQVPPDDDRYRDRIMIAPNHIESGTGRILLTETADAQGASSGKYLVKPGDIIYSKIRPALNKACIATGHWLCSADMYPVAVSTDDLTPKYLLYFILSEPFVRRMVDESMRVAMPKVNRETVADCPLLLPPLNEQEGIVRHLDWETARISGLVTKKARLIELLQEKRAALITRAVTKGLDPSVPMKDSGVEWLEEIPAHWNTTTLRRAAREIVDCPHDTPRYSEDGNHFVIRTADVNEGGLDLANARRVDDVEFKHRVRRLTLAPGDIVYSREGERFGLAAAVPAEVSACLGQRMMQVRAGGSWLPRFMMWQLNARHVYQQARVYIAGATSPHVNVETVRRFVLFEPPLQEQRTIADFVDRKVQEFDRLLASLKEAIDRLEELRSALISAAVTGKIDVRAA